MVLLDDGGGVEGKDAKAIDPAADALTVAATTAGAADGEVELDRGVRKGECGEGALVQAATPAIAAVDPVTAEGLVVVHGGAADLERRRADLDEAATGEEAAAQSSTAAAA